MSDITKKALACCGEFGLHIKRHCEESRKNGIYHMYGTHYIMRGAKIIVSLHESDVAWWVVRKSEEARRVESLLKSDGLELTDRASCLKSLKETVSPKANLRIYEDFLK